MRRSNDLTLSPNVQIDRETLAGGVFATAANLGMSLGQAAHSHEVHRPIAIEVPICGVEFRATVGQRLPLGLCLVDDACCYGFAFANDGSCAVVAQTAELNASQCGQRAEKVATSVRAQLVKRHVLTGLRDWGFTILEQAVSTDTVLTQRARLPLTMRPRPSARTTRADFVLTVDHAGTVSVRLNQLRFANRQTVAANIREMLTTLPGDNGSAPIPTRVAKACASEIRIDAA